VALGLAAAGEVDGAFVAREAAAATSSTGGGNPAPIAHYHRAHLLGAAGRHADAAAARGRAREVDQRWAFPAGVDDHDALVAAIAVEGDAVAHGLRGMLLYGGSASPKPFVATKWQQPTGTGADPADRVGP
jgi:hypothetical protein